MTSRDEDIRPTTGHIRRVLRFFGVVIATPFVMGLISEWAAGLGFFLFLFGAPIVFGVFVFGGIALAIRGITISRSIGAPHVRAFVALAAPLMMILTIALAQPALAIGDFAGSWTRLMANQTRYATIIAEIEREHRPAGTLYADEYRDGVAYSVDAGPPVRVAFNPAGMLDNWSGIVFDPTDDVMLARGFDPKTGKFHAPDRVTKLFGGDLVGCRHLWRHYYQCSFT